MKKFLLFPIAIFLFVSANAQTEKKYDPCADIHLFFNVGFKDTLTVNDLKMITSITIGLDSTACAKTLKYEAKYPVVSALYTIKGKTYKPGDDDDGYKLDVPWAAINALEQLKPGDKFSATVVVAYYKDDVFQKNITLKKTFYVK